MIVDDSAFMRLLVRRAVESDGHEVVAEAERAEELVAAFADAEPDVTLLDLFLPDGDAVAALEALLADAPEARVVVYAEMWQEEAAVRAMQAGARELLVKPLRDDQIVDAILLGIAPFSGEPCAA